MERERVRAILAKIETTSGTDSVPVAATDAVPTVGFPTIELAYLEQGERNDVQTGVLIATDRAAAAGRYARVTGLKLEVKPGGAAGLAPEADVFLRGAGMSKTVVGGVSVQYTTIDESMETTPNHSCSRPWGWISGTNRRRGRLPAQPMG
jgi:hypothetical protein